VAVQGSIENHQEEVLVVPKTNAIVNPGTMVVHFQDAHLAVATMVATVWLVLGAPLAVSTLPILLLLNQLWDFDLLAGHVVP